MKVPSSIDATGTRDVSSEMAAFYSTVLPGAVVDYPCRGRYRMESTLRITKRGLTINGNESTFFSTTRGTRNRSNVFLKDSADVIINRLHTVGANPHAGLADDAFVVELEAQHGFEFMNSRRVRLADCASQDTYGDFIYVAGQSVDLLFERFFGTRSGRSGTALVNGDKIVYDECVMTDCRRSTFDFEPVLAHQIITNVDIKNGVFGPHRLNWMAAHGNGSAKVGHIHVSDCAVIGGVMNVTVTANVVPSPTVPGNRFDWRFDRCTSDRGYGNPRRAAMLFANTRGVHVHDCDQPMQKITPGMHMVAITRCLDVDVAGNTGTNLAGQVRIDA